MNRREEGGTMWAYNTLIYLLATLRGHGATFRPMERPFGTVPTLDLSGCLITARHASCRHQDLSLVPSALPGDTLQLDVSDNRIALLSAASLGRYSSLVVLTAQRNGLRSVAGDSFRGLRDLERLDLSENRLDRLPTAGSLARALSMLPNLLHLDLSRNGLEDAALGDLLDGLNSSSLVSLSLAGNSLRSIAARSFAELPSLRHLDLELNAIHSISPGAFGFGASSRLETISLAYNSLECVSAFGLPRLRRLNLSSNAIEYFDSDDSLGEYRLESLDLSHNNLLSFPRLPAANALRHLNASHNRIAFEELSEALEFRLQVDGGGAATAGRPFEILAGPLLNGTDADLSESTFKPVDLSSLRTLDLSHNAIERLPRELLASAPGLTALDLSNNCLRDLDDAFNCSLARLGTLDLSHNSLESLSGRRADGNAAGKAAAWPLWSSVAASLRGLNVRDNQVAWLPPSFFVKMRALEELDMSQNAVTAVCGGKASDRRPRGGGGVVGTNGSRSDRFGRSRKGEECVRFSGSASLRRLDLSECRLRTVGPAAFDGTLLTHLNLSLNADLGSSSDRERAGQLLRGLEHSLESLDLRGSSLWRWWRAADFASLRKLRFLDLAANNLSAVPPGVFATACQRLDLRDNSLARLPAERLSAPGSTLLSLHLSGNPFNCCAADAWMAALRGSRVDVPDRDRATCLRPPGSDSGPGTDAVPLWNATEDGCRPRTTVPDGASERNPVTTVVIVSTIVIAVLGFGVLFLIKPNLMPFF